MLDQLIARVGSDRPVNLLELQDVDALLRTGGGTSIGNGLLRLHTGYSAQAADIFVRAAFPEFSRRVRCFAFDWLGRQFSIDLESADDSHSGVILMLEPGTGEVLTIPVVLSEFFHEEIVDYPDAALAESFFMEWKASGGRAPAFTESVGYRTPLFLGGVDEVSNLELTDTAVYWDVVGQIRIRASELPAGTRIGTVTIDDE
ncbi:MAG: hypothetical protein ACTHNQ_05205 [Microbacterium sp.]|uniref:hypothetical protein n=1 Tax=Microbacterium sp. TaxID=51671 RepID=UPI003F7E000C